MVKCKLYWFNIYPKSIFCVCLSTAELVKMHKDEQDRFSLFLGGVNEIKLLTERYLKGTVSFTTFREGGTTFMVTIPVSLE